MEHSASPLHVHGLIWLDISLCVYGLIWTGTSVQLINQIRIGIMDIHGNVSRLNWLSIPIEMFMD